MSWEYWAALAICMTLVSILWTLKRIEWLLEMFAPRVVQIDRSGRRVPDIWLDAIAQRIEEKRREKSDD